MYLGYMMRQVKGAVMRVSTNPPLLVHRLSRLLAGLVLFGISIALMITAGLGVDSWDVLHQGLSRTIGLPFGWVVTGVSVVVLALWVPLRQRPGIGTVANALVVGMVADLTLRILSPARGLAAQLAILSLAIIANGLATGLYIGAGLGPGPRDGLMTGLAGRTRWSIRSVRTAIEVVVLATGWAIGGQVGVGTVLFAGTIGPLSQYFITRLSVDEQSGRSARVERGALANAPSQVHAAC
jgi:uncharacterized membrane protein YczE